MLQKFVAFILITILINACCGSKTSSELKNHSGNYSKIAESKLGENYKIIFNSDSTFLIAYRSVKNASQSINPPLKFLVYSFSEKRVIFEDNLTNGQVEWIDNNQLKVSTIPGIVSGKEEKNKSLLGYTFDVKLKRKVYPEEEIKNNK